MLLSQFALSQLGHAGMPSMLPFADDAHDSRLANGELGRTSDGLCFGRATVKRRWSQWGAPRLFDAMNQRPSGRETKQMNHSSLPLISRCGVAEALALLDGGFPPDGPPVSRSGRPCPSLN